MENKTEIKEIFVICAIENSYECEHGFTALHYAFTKTEMLNKVGELIFSKEFKKPQHYSPFDYLMIYKAKAMVINGEIYTKAITYSPDDCFTDNYENKFVSWEKLDSLENSIIERDAKKSLAYLNRLKARKTEEAKEREEKEYAIQIKKRQKELEERSLYLELKEKYEGKI